MNLAFKVKRVEDMTAVGISQSVDKFVNEACKRQTDSTLPAVQDGSGQYKQVCISESSPLHLSCTVPVTTPRQSPQSGICMSHEAVPVQVLLVYFSGHGVRMRGQQLAVGRDSRVVNINKNFVHALKSKLRNCAIILLMDACGDCMHVSPDASAMHLKDVSGDEDSLNGNLIVCAYACQVCVLQFVILHHYRVSKACQNPFPRWCNIA